LWTTTIYYDGNSVPEKTGLTGYLWLGYFPQTQQSAMGRLRRPHRLTAEGQPSEIQDRRRGILKSEEFDRLPDLTLSNSVTFMQAY
jgi:hypothetical protein